MGGWRDPLLHSVRLSALLQRLQPRPDPPGPRETWTRDTFGFRTLEGGLADVMRRPQIRTAAYKFHSPYWDEVSYGAKDLISSLLVVNPARRYTAHQCLEHRWIQTAAKIADSSRKLHRLHLPPICSKRVIPERSDSNPPARAALTAPSSSSASCLCSTTWSWRVSRTSPADWRLSRSLRGSTWCGPGRWETPCISSTPARSR